MCLPSSQAGRLHEPPRLRLPGHSGGHCHPANAASRPLTPRSPRGLRQKLGRTRFSQEASGVNVLEAGGKGQVLQRQASLRDSAQKSGQTRTILSITDSDGDGVSDESKGRYQWPAYHIENYLLEPKYIGLAIDSIMANTPGTTSLQYVQELVRDSKNEAASEIGRRTLVRKLKSRLHGHLQLNAGALDQDLTASNLRRQLQDCRNAINTEFDRVIEVDELKRELKRQKDETTRLQKQKITPDTLPGRDVLRKVSGRATPNGSYETLRNAILRTLTKITLPCAKRAKPEKTGCAWMQLATLYRALSLMKWLETSINHRQ